MNTRDILTEIKNILTAFDPAGDDRDYDRMLAVDDVIKIVDNELAKRPMKTKIVNLSSNRSDLSAYNDTEELANGWLDAHPEAEILHMTSTLAANTEWSEHCITLAVRVPVEE